MTGNEVSTMSTMLSIIIKAEFRGAFRPFGECTGNCP